MEPILELFGEGKELTILQMCLRTVVTFFYALVLIRIAGRRSFGLNAPFDIIIIVLLGAVLSRAVVGASPFIPTFCAGFLICVLHRIMGLLSVGIPWVEHLIKGQKILLYQDGQIIEGHLARSLVSLEDIKEEMRRTFHNESFEDVEAIYMERNGKISIVKKDEDRKQIY